MLAIRSVSAHAQLLHFTFYHRATCLALTTEVATGLARVRLSNSVMAGSRDFVCLFGGSLG